MIAYACKYWNISVVSVVFIENFQHNQHHDTLLPIIPCRHKLKAGIAYWAETRAKNFPLTWLFVRLYIICMSFIIRIVSHLSLIALFTFKFQKTKWIFTNYQGQWTTRMETKLSEPSSFEVEIQSNSMCYVAQRMNVYIFFIYVKVALASKFLFSYFLKMLLNCIVTSFEDFCSHA